MSGEPRPRLAMRPRLLLSVSVLVAVLVCLILAGWALGVLLIPLTGGVDAAAVHGLRTREGDQVVAVMRVVTWLGSGVTVAALGVPVGTALLLRGRPREVAMLGAEHPGRGAPGPCRQALGEPAATTDPLVQTGTASFPPGTPATP